MYLKNILLMNRWSGWLIIVWIELLYWTHSNAWPRPFDDWKELVFYFGSGCFTISFLLSSIRHQPIFRLNYLFLIFFIYFFIGLFSLNQSPYEGLLVLAQILLWGGFTWFLLQMSHVRLMRITIVATLSATLIAVVSYIHLNIVPLAKQSINFLPWIGHVSYYGDFMMLHLPLAGLLVFRSFTKSPQRILYGLCFLLIGFGIWISGSRASLFASVFTFAIFLVVITIKKTLNFKKLSLIVLTILAFLTTIMLANPKTARHTSQRLQSYFSSPWESYSLTGGRSPMWLNTWQMIQQRPLNGWGIGSFPFVYPEFANAKVKDHAYSVRQWVVHPHNELLHQWSEIGLFGLVAFALFWTFIYFVGFQNIFKIIDLENFSAIFCGLLGLTMILLTWQINTTFTVPLIRFLVSLHIALILKNIFLPKKFILSVLLKRKTWAPLATITVIVAVSLISTYSLSLYVLGKGRVTLSYKLAPLAFIPLYHYTTFAMDSMDTKEAERALYRLYHQYPRVPAVLYKMGVWWAPYDPEKASHFLKSALKKDPNFTLAQDLLRRLNI